MEKCFAMGMNGKCVALDVDLCTEEKAKTCPFYKTGDRLREERAAAIRRIYALNPEATAAIEDIYNVSKVYKKMYSGEIK